MIALILIGLIIGTPIFLVVCLAVRPWFFNNILEKLGNLKGAKHEHDR